MFTGIWQFRTPGEFDWMNEIFGEFISEYVWDCKREVAPDNSILFDSYICDSDPAYFRRFRGKNAFLVHVYDETFDGLYEETYSNFRGVFRFFWSDVFNPERVFKLPLGYCKGFASDGGPLKPATERRYLWSFVGDAAKSSRAGMVRALAAVQPNLLISTQPIDYADVQPTGLPPVQCADVLRESVFAPSPMGNVQIECFRAYEALESGTIPIVEKRLTLDYYRELLGDHPLPTVSSWAQARELVTSLHSSPAKLDALQRRCIDWWVEYKQSLKRDVGHKLLRTEPIHDSRILSPIAQLPGWRMLALLRHHDSQAILWRMRRQWKRSLSQRPWLSSKAM